jgi:RecB family endonuclease NucS
MQEQSFKEREDLQRILKGSISVIEQNLLILAEEFSQWEDSRRRVDLLALDRKGSLVVIELKRTEDGGHMELQAIRYAAMVSTLSFQQAVNAHAANQSHQKTLARLFALY